MDESLAHRMGDLPLATPAMTGAVIWRHAATVSWNGNEHKVCIGFDLTAMPPGYPEPPAVSVGILLDDGRVTPIEQVMSRDLVPVERVLPARQRKRGVSIVFLMQYLRHMETWLIDDQSAHDEAGTSTESLLYALQLRAVEEQIPVGMVAAFCAASAVTDAFYNSHVYGGAANMQELRQCLDYLVENVGDYLGSILHDMERQLRRLSAVAEADWSPEHFALQRHVVTYILIFLRIAETDENEGAS